MVNRSGTAPSVLLVACLALACLYGAPAPAEPADKPADPDFVYEKALFDCTPRQTLYLVPGLATTIADSTYGAGQAPSYSCKAWSETGPEAVYELVVLDSFGPVELFAGLRDLGELDLDLFLLTICDTDSCLVGANIEFSLVLQPGTYRLVVDGYSQPVPQAGPFTLAIEARYSGLPDQICSGAASTPVLCGGESQLFENDLYYGDDLVRTADCSPILEKSNDHWYALTVPGGHKVELDVTPVTSSLDLALWLFDGCGPEPVCLDFADEKTGGQGESLVYVNLGEEAVTVYLGVDGPAPITQLYTGAYSLSVGQAIVPTRKTSFGSVKSLFR